MNKKPLLAVVVIVILVIGGAALVYFLQDKNSYENSENVTPITSVSSDDTSKKLIDGGSQAVAGSYEEYSEDLLAKTAGTKLLYFHAPWCPQCRAMEASIKKDGVPKGVTVFKVDYDSNQDLRKKYGVTLQTTFVKVDDNGDKLDSYVAYEKPEFSAVEQALLR